LERERKRVGWWVEVRREERVRGGVGEEGGGGRGVEMKVLKGTEGG